MRSRAAIENLSASTPSRHLRNSVRLVCFFYAMRMASICVPVRLCSLGQIVPLTGAPAKAGTKAICPRSLRLHEKPRFAGPPLHKGGLRTRSRAAIENLSGTSCHLPLPGEAECSPEETIAATLHPSGAARHLPYRGGFKCRSPVERKTATLHPSGTARHLPYRGGLATRSRTASENSSGIARCRCGQPKGWSFFVLFFVGFFSGRNLAFAPQKR
jgi:hypothetical protein